jgi:hypothetical protein
MMVIHGTERQGSRHARQLDAFCREKQADRAGPGVRRSAVSFRLFNMGGIETRDRSKWSFQIVEHLFDFVRADEGLTATRYLLFGHSAAGNLCTASCC